MSTDTTLTAALDRFERVAKLLSSDLTPMAVSVAKAAKSEALAAGRQVTGGSGVLSHMGRKGAHLGAGYTIMNQGRQIQIAFRPAGAWIIMDTGAKPHGEPRKSRGNRSGKGKRKGAMYGSGLAHPLVHVDHPGMRGRQALKIAAERIDKVTGPAADEWIRGELAKIFGG